jgi:hypothetical protein
VCAARRCLATLCIGDGMGNAMCLARARSFPSVAER